jgi:hypothetical protein
MFANDLQRVLQSVGDVGCCWWVMSQQAVGDLLLLFLHQPCNCCFSQGVICKTLAVGRQFWVGSSCAGQDKFGKPCSVAGRLICVFQAVHAVMVAAAHS